MQIIKICPILYLRDLYGSLEIIMMKINKKKWVLLQDPFFYRIIVYIYFMLCNPVLFLLQPYILPGQIHP